MGRHKQLPYQGKIEVLFKEWGSRGKTVDRKQVVRLKRRERV